MAAFTVVRVMRRPRQGFRGKILNWTHVAELTWSGRTITAIITEQTCEALRAAGCTVVEEKPRDVCVNCHVRDDRCCCAPG